ncbi:energy transducer TonB [Undibacterium oligocarboniphilum]|uniref:TonB family protein n=1 Tax=Undibacterium oligocarboniphilum TaxID=666702 RepID=A0A850QLY5_9BURK|nr:energy transducer TonB [Undibacterium oligocarboniphilum]MBC3869781.1 TonB family protein [Undibacterium oligocarboniphilum]NVO77384.1 TonB family protein [Undibacterium oligocarboniphilum]
MNKVVQNSSKIHLLPACSLLAASLILTACSKTPAPEENSSTPPSSAPPSQSSAQPTGLVKNPVSHDHVADVTKWMDQASTKTAAQIAQEEKLLKETREKQVQEAKHAQENKTVQAKNTATAKESLPAASVPAPVTTPTIAPKPVETAPPAATTAAPATPPTTAQNKPAEPERIVLKLINNIQPKYPATAVRAGVTEGSVSALIHVETDGKVSKVDIIKARPAKHFDKEVISTVMQWRYAPISRPQTTVVEFNFKVD